MWKRWVLAGMTVTAAATGLLVTGAASGHAAQAASRSIRLTQRLFQYSSTGNPPSSGSNSYVGTSDGRIGARADHGTVRGVNTYGGGVAFAGRNTIFDPNGSIGISFNATLGQGGAISGSGRFSGGTGRYSHARGRFTFTATRESDGSYLRVLTGKVSYGR